MRIITSRKLRFYTKDRKQSFVTEGSNIIQDCPDWAVDDAMFQAARASGQLQILASSKDLKKAENEKVLSQTSHEAQERFNQNMNESGEEIEVDDEVVEETEIDEEAARKAAKKAARKARKAAKNSNTEEE